MPSQHCCQAAIRWTICGISILSLIVSIVVVANCEFLTRTYFGTFGYQHQLGSGLFTYEKPLGGGCVSYDDEYKVSSPHATSRAFGVLAVLICFAAMLCATIVLTCLTVGQNAVWMATRVLLALALFSQGLTFSIFGDPHCDEESVECNLGPGARTAIFNMLLLLVALIMALFVPSPERPAISCCGAQPAVAADSSPEQQQNKPVQDEEQPHWHQPKSVRSITTTCVRDEDGNTVSTEQVTLWDGTITTTKTVEDGAHHAAGFLPPPVAPPIEEAVPQAEVIKVEDDDNVV